MKTIKIIRPGLCATIQDRGRFGFQDSGIPVSGAMDPWAYRLGNLLVGNPDDAASIEITLGGFEAEILTDTCLAVTGANTGICLNDRPIPTWTALGVRSGDRLSIPYARKGARDYLALAGGILVPLVMGSRSTYLRGGFGGLEGRALRKGDILESESFRGKALTAPIPPTLIPSNDRRLKLRVILGPQDDEII